MGGTGWRLPQRAGYAASRHRCFCRGAADRGARRETPFRERLHTAQNAEWSCGPRSINVERCPLADRALVVLHLQLGLIRQ